MSTTKKKIAATPSAKSKKQKGYIAAYKLKHQDDLDSSKLTQDVLMLWGSGHV